LPNTTIKLKYFLDFESRDNAALVNFEHFKKPFSYKLKVNPEEVGEPEEADEGEGSGCHLRGGVEGAVVILFLLFLLHQILQCDLRHVVRRWDTNNDFQNTKTYYKDDPFSDNIKKVIYDYIEVNNSEKAIAGGQADTIRTYYGWIDIAETRNGITRSVAAMDYIKMIDASWARNLTPTVVSAYLETLLPPEAMIYDATFYMAAPNAEKATDRVIDYRINYVNVLRH